MVHQVSEGPVKSSKTFESYSEQPAKNNPQSKTAAKPKILFIFFIISPKNKIPLTVYPPPPRTLSSKNDGAYERLQRDILQFFSVVGNFNSAQTAKKK